MSPLSAGAARGRCVGGASRGATRALLHPPRHCRRRQRLPVLPRLPLGIDGVGVYSQRAMLLPFRDARTIRVMAFVRVSGVPRNHRLCHCPASGISSSGSS